MLWNHYVFRRGSEVFEMWDDLFSDRSSKLLYIAGRGFDIRAQKVLDSFIEGVKGKKFESAKLLLIDLKTYVLSSDLQEQTKQNSKNLEERFAALGPSLSVDIGPINNSGDENESASNALRSGITSVIKQISDQTDVIVDVSSLPRVVYLSLITNILQKLIPDKKKNGALSANNVNLQILVAEDANLDSKILSEDPSNELIIIPGFTTAMHAECVQDWPLVWFPILGENRVSQLQHVMNSTISEAAEICPVLPHPSKDLRRADRLLVEYKTLLFDSLHTPTANILYVHENHPFEAYRQLYRAMNRYKESMMILGGCRLYVTPLASKLITIGAGLACFEMKPRSIEENYAVAIPYVEPTRYVASVDDLQSANAEISSLLLTGTAYSSMPHS